MTEQSPTASYHPHQIADDDNKVVGYKKKPTKIGRWNLVADSASKTWCDSQPHVLTPSIEVEAQITATHDIDTYNADSAVTKHTLTLTYCIALPLDANSANLISNVAINKTHSTSTIEPWFTWQALSPSVANSKTVDFLWQSTCLECFIAGTTSDGQPNKSQQYIEINIASNGQSQIYHFDDYRTPECLPPRKLNNLPIIHNYLQQNLATHDPNASYLLEITPIANMADGTIIDNQAVFTRQVSMDLSPLTQIWQSLTLIHPTVILQHRNSLTQLFFAPIHANPPDFHKYELWHDMYYPL